MQKLFIISLLVMLSVPVLAENKIPLKDKSEILLLFEKQKEAWNEGNLEKFMETYLKSENLVFVGARGATYGWQAALDNYKKGYPDKNAMGKLELKVLKMSKIDIHTVFVVGRFELSREIGDLAGHFTLVIQKIEGNWLIVSDHSSAEN
uniref:YybH family protein n=1 Tax=uncultured Draconibacterium sp. TaxID=1573823 RepID=UPI003217F560